MVRVSLGGAAAAFVVAWAGGAWTGGAWAQAASGQSAPKPASDQNTLSDVVIEAVRPGIVRRIDRDVYDIKDDPQAKAAPLIDILGKLPAVSVGGDGKVRLLGTPGVQVLFDGKPVQGADQKLQTLTGADVEHIEVMTNPSSQFAARGSGGIINIVTRKHYKPGWSGQVSATANNDHGGDLRLSPTLTYGKWTFSGSAGLSYNEPSSTWTQDLSRLAADGAVLDTRDEQARITHENSTRFVSGKVAYKPTDKQSLTLSAQNYGVRSLYGSASDIRSTAAGFSPYAQRADSRSIYNGGGFGLAYEREGPHEGESLKLDADYDRSTWRAATSYAEDGVATHARYGNHTGSVDRETSIKGDYERPIGAKRMLTAGAAWERDDETAQQTLENVSGAPTLPAPYARYLPSRRDVAAGYATLQFPIGTWTVLPGLRFEDMALDVRAPGGLIRAHDGDWFPSLHVSRDLPAAVKLKLSYSRRVARVDPQDLDPTVYYQNSTSAQTGNPDLRSVFTDAYEIKLSKTRKAISADLTLYDRLSDGELATVQQLLPGDVTLASKVNGGRVDRRGGEASLRGPLIGRWKYVATANVYQLENPVLDGAAYRTARTVTYDGSLQLDYKAAAKAGAQPQQLQLSVRFFGPQQMLQSRTSAFFTTDATWRWPLTKKVSGVLTATDLLKTWKSRTRRWGEAFVETTETRQHAPRVRLALTYQLGGKP